MSSRFERFFFGTPDGRPRTALPWESLSAFERDSMPLLVRHRTRLALPLVLCGAGLFVIGYLGTKHGLFAVGAALLSVVVRSYVQAWRRIGAVEVFVGADEAKHAGDQPFALSVEVSSAPRETVGRFAVFAVCNGASEGEAVAFGRLDGPHERRLVPLAWKLDRGMGRYEAANFRVVVADDLGFFPMAVDVDGKVAVTIEPSVEPLARFPLPDHGAATDQGAFETRAPGDAVSFRGLRPWRIGDGMRKIDWKRSQRAQALLVKEFERVAATSATVVLDLDEAHQAHFAGLSTFATLKSSAFAVVEHLLDQRVKTTFVADDVTLTLGAAYEDRLIVRDIVRDLAPNLETRLSTVLERVIAAVEPDSLMVLCASAANVVLDELWASLIHLDERRVETILVLVDTSRFATVIRRQVKVDTFDRPAIAELVKVAASDTGGALRTIASKLLARTFVLGPDAPLAAVLSGGDR